MGNHRQVRIANAPVSFGVFGLADAHGVSLAPERLLVELAALGYSGIDLGPPGWLGAGPLLRERLDAAGLDLAGGWVDLPFQDRRRYAEQVPDLERALDLFVAGRGRDEVWWPKPTLAVTSTPEREAHPGGGGTTPSLRLDDDEWKVLATNIADAAARCRDRGLEPTFHHHACTFVEAVPEIERFLDLTDVGLTLDTGHLLMVGGNPVQALRAWADRVNHVHVKDVLMSKVDEAVQAGADMHEVWRRNLFCPLGEGDLDLAGVIAAVASIDFTGWVVVEQDVVPGQQDSFERILADQAHNLEQLTTLGMSDSSRG